MGVLGGEHVQGLLLFGGTMDGSVSIAHNFKRYDSYFILKYLYDNKVRPG